MTEEQRLTIRYQSRKAERRSLLGVALLTLLGFGTLYLVRLVTGAEPPISDWLRPLGFAGLLLGLHAVLMVARFEGDQVLLPAAGVVAGLGLLYRDRLDAVAPGSVWVEGAAAVVILLFALVLRRGRTRWLTRLWLPAILGASGLLIWLMIQGQVFRGSRFAPGLRTPGEILKILIPVFLAGFLATRQESFRRGPVGLPIPRLGPAALFLLLWSVPQGLLILQPDLGQVAIFGILLVTILFVATGRSAYVVLGGVATFLAGSVVFRFVHHGRGRILAWLSPFGDPGHQGWQSVQSLLALFSGGLLGHGLGLGNPERVPMVTTDFIYASIGEDLGWIGSALLLGAYLILIQRAYRISFRISDVPGRLLGVGLTTVLAAQTFLNVGGVVKFVPITGVTLPLISRGGSSLLVTAAALGILLALSEPGVPRSQGGRIGSDRAGPVG